MIPQLQYDWIEVHEAINLSQMRRIAEAYYCFSDQMEGLRFRVGYYHPELFAILQRNLFAEVKKMVAIEGRGSVSLLPLPKPIQYER